MSTGGNAGGGKPVKAVPPVGTPAIQPGPAAAAGQGAGKLPAGMAGAKGVAYLVGGVIVALVGIVLVFLAVKISLGVLSSLGSGRTTETAPREEYQAAAQSAADLFLNDLKTRRAESAYVRTSKRYQDYKTEPEFRDMVDDLTVFHRFTERQLEIKRTDPPHRVTYLGWVKGPNGSSSFTLEMFFDAGEWKVDRFQVP